jgi:hypothetical protein
MFVLFYPNGTEITRADGSSCATFDAFHDETQVAGAAIPFTVVARCSRAVSDIALAAGAELVAATTDPRPSTQPAWIGFDALHEPWTIALGGEVSDACQGLAPVAAGDVAFGRTWSNASIAAYHDPCVPTPDETPYFVSVPIMTDDVAVTDLDHVTGVRVAVGHAKTIEVQLLSDGPTSGPWTVSVVSSFLQDPPLATFAFDRTSGTNGEKLHLTIVPHVEGPRSFLVKSTLGARSTYWAGIVGQ